MPKHVRYVVKRHLDCNGHIRWGLFRAVDVEGAANPVQYGYGWPVVSSRNRKEVKQTRKTLMAMFDGDVWMKTKAQPKKKHRIVLPKKKKKGAKNADRRDGRTLRLRVSTAKVHKPKKFRLRRK